MYLVKVSITTMMSLLPDGDFLLRGPNKSMWTRSFGSPAMGRLCRGAFTRCCFYASWHLVQSLMNRWTSAVIPGHQKLSSILAMVLSAGV